MSGISSRIACPRAFRNGFSKLGGIRSIVMFSLFPPYFALNRHGGRRDRHPAHKQIDGRMRGSWDELVRSGEQDRRADRTIQSRLGIRPPSRAVDIVRLALLQFAGYVKFLIARMSWFRISIWLAGIIILPGGRGIEPGWQVPSAVPLLPSAAHRLAGPGLPLSRPAGPGRCRVPGCTRQAGPSASASGSQRTTFLWFRRPKRPYGGRRVPGPSPPGCPADPAARACG